MFLLTNPGFCDILILFINKIRKIRHDITYSVKPVSVVFSVIPCAERKVGALP